MMMEYQVFILKLLKTCHFPGKYHNALTKMTRFGHFLLMGCIPGRLIHWPFSMLETFSAKIFRQVSIFPAHIPVTIISIWPNQQKKMNE
jgi:hypothetical protein